jgi:hypothetical protein
VVAAGAASAAASFGTRLGESSNLGGRIVTPLAVVEESRCPLGAQCIQAGTLRLRVRVQRGQQDEMKIVGLNSPADLGGAWLHLARACPHPSVSRPVAPADYRLTFVLSDSAALPPAPIACPAG